MAAMGMAKDRPDLLGYQPCWGDFGNVRGWDYRKSTAVNFGPEGPMGARDAPINRSLWLAVQLAPRLGYRDVVFAGVDLDDEQFSPMLEVLRRWWDLADKQGMRWRVSSYASRLAEFLQVEV